MESLSSSNTPLVQTSICYEVGQKMIIVNIMKKWGSTKPTDQALLEIFNKGIKSLENGAKVVREMVNSKQLLNLHFFLPLDLIYFSCMREAFEISRHKLNPEQENRLSENLETQFHHYKKASSHTKGINPENKESLRRHLNSFQELHIKIVRELYTENLPSLQTAIKIVNTLEDEALARLPLASILNFQNNIPFAKLKSLCSEMRNLTISQEKFQNDFEKCLSSESTIPIQLLQETFKRYLYALEDAQHHLHYVTIKQLSIAKNINKLIDDEPENTLQKRAIDNQIQKWIDHFADCSKCFETLKSARDLSTVTVKKLQDCEQLIAEYFPSMTQLKKVWHEKTNDSDMMLIEESFTKIWDTSMCGIGETLANFKYILRASILGIKKLKKLTSDSPECAYYHLTSFSPWINLHPPSWLDDDSWMYDSPQSSSKKKAKKQSPKSKINQKEELIKTTGNSFSLENLQIQAFTLALEQKNNPQAATCFRQMAWHLSHAVTIQKYVETKTSKDLRGAYMGGITHSYWATEQFMAALISLERKPLPKVHNLLILSEGASIPSNALLNDLTFANHCERYCMEYFHAFQNSQFSRLGEFPLLLKNVHQMIVQPNSLTNETLKTHLTTLFKDVTELVSKHQPSPSTSTKVSIETSSMKNILLVKSEDITKIELLDSHFSLPEKIFSHKEAKLSQVYFQYKLYKDTLSVLLTSDNFSLTHLQIIRTLRVSQNLLSDLLAYLLFVKKGFFTKNHEISVLAKQLGIEGVETYKATFEGLSLASRYPLDESYNSLGVKLIFMIEKLANESKKEAHENDPWKHSKEVVTASDLQNDFKTYIDTVYKLLEQALKLLKD